VILLFAGVAMTQLAPGDPFPELKGEYVSGGGARLPADTRGRTVLVAIGFTLDALDPVQTWILRFLQDYDHHPRVVSFDVPMLSGMARVGKEIVQANIRKYMVPASHKHVITVTSRVGDWKRRVGFQSPKHPYLLLYDQNGVVRWRHAENFEEARYQELNAVIRSLIGFEGKPLILKTQ
jgi:hypothetical protein